MKQKSYIIDWIIRLAFCILYSNALTLAATGGLSLAFSTVTVIGITTLAAACFYLMFGFRKVSKIVLLSVLGLIIAGLVTAVLLCLFGVIDYAKLYQSVLDMMSGYKRVDVNQSRIIIIVISAAISLLSAFLLSRKIIFIACAAIAFAVFILQQLTGNIFNYGYFAFLTYIVIIIGVYSVFVRFEKASGGQDFGYKRLGVLAFCVVCSVAVLIMTVLMPFGNTYSKTFNIEDLNPNAFNNRGQGYFQLSAAGVGSNDAYMGDVLKLNFDDVFELTSAEPTYIVATYNDTYTGSGWKVSDSMTTKYAEDAAGLALLASARNLNGMFAQNETVELDAMMKVYALERAGIEYSVDNITVKFADSSDYFRSVLRTSDLVNISKPDKRLLWNDIDSNLYTNLYFRKNLSYSFASLNYNKSDLYAYLRSDAYADGMQTSPDFDEATVTNDKNRIYTNYVQLPETVPQRVYSLAERIVADSGAVTRFDKVWALMEYLWRYDYRTSVDDLAKNSDFVDSFIFGDSFTDEPSEEYYGGYCTGFASSLAVMCRTIGIPTRYVEGFSPLESAGEGLMVDNSYAHSWVEVYFDGVGWVTFEPTTRDAEAYYGVNTDDYEIKPPEPENPEESEGEEEEDTPTVSEQPVESEIPEQTESLPDEPLPEINNDTSIGNSVLIESESGFKLTVKDLIIALCCLAGAVLLVMIPMSIVSARKRQMERIKTLKNRAYAKAVFRELTRLMRYMEVEREESETVHTYLIRLGELCKDKRIADSFIGFDKALYSEEPVTDNDRAYIELAYNICNAYAISHSNKFMFNLNRYLLHRM